MLKHVWLLFISTFVFGFLTGAVIFLVNSTGKEGDGSLQGAGDLAISARAYGGCSRIGCPSYRIEENGSYTYLKWNAEGKELRFTDKLSARQRDTLKAELEKTDFDKIDDSEFTGTCPIVYDGLAYVYEIEYEGESYEVDTCIENVQLEELFVTLEEYFSIFSILYDKA